MAALLLDFIYAHVEATRRRSLNEMLRAASDCQSDDDLRARILDYLEQSEYDERLNDVIGSQNGGVDELPAILDDITSPGEAAALRGAVARLLGSYPDLPGLLFLRSVSEALARDAAIDAVVENFGAALKFAADPYGLDRSAVAMACGQAISNAARKHGVGPALFEAVIASPWAERSFVRELLPLVPFDSAIVGLAWLQGELATAVSALR